MTRPNLQISVRGMIAIVACVATNFWLFRVGFLFGLLGLNVTKHVLTAYLCHSVGLDRREAVVAVPPPPPEV